MQLGADVILGVEKLREFPDRQPVAHRQRKVRHEIGFVRIEHRSFDNFSAKKVRPVEDKEGDFAFRGFLHAITHRCRIRVEPHARVLNIEDQRINTLEHFLRGTPRLPIKTVNGKACRRIFGG